MTRGVSRHVYQIVSTDRRGRIRDVIELDDLRRAKRFFDVGCRYGTPLPGRGRERVRGGEVTLKAGRLLPARTYGVGIEPEQLAPAFKPERVLGVCRVR